MAILQIFASIVPSILAQRASVAYSDCWPGIGRRVTLPKFGTKISRRRLWLGPQKRFQYCVVPSFPSIRSFDLESIHCFAVDSDFGYIELML